MRKWQLYTSKEIKPKGWLIRQLEIQAEALEAVAQKALARKIGARGLRSVMESIMSRIMFEIPSDLTIRKVIITKECITGSEPTIIRDANNPRRKLGANN